MSRLLNTVMLPRIARTAPMIVTPRVALALKDRSTSTPVLLKAHVALWKVSFTRLGARFIELTFGRKYVRAPELPAGKAMTSRRGTTSVLFVLVSRS